MKLGVLTNLMGNKSFAEVSEYLSSLGVQCVEVGCGGYPGKAHADPGQMLSDNSKITEFKNTLVKNNLTLSALSCHGNPVHPDKKTANEFHEDFKNAILLAEKMEIDTVVGFSGCPGDSEGSKYPNWVTCSWPEDYTKILDYQWNQVLIPYWKDMAKFAKEHGISKIAFEMHPGFCVYNTGSLIRLREAVGDIVGANFDPSHLFWQGINPIEAIRELEGAIYHFHAKDTKINDKNTAINGVLDTGHYGKELTRSWVFRTVGYGHDYAAWKDMMSMLRMIGYDGAISIEHEDSLMSTEEGLKKAITFLKEVMMFEDKMTEMYWA